MSDGNVSLDANQLCRISDSHPCGLLTIVMPGMRPSPVTSIHVGTKGDVPGDGLCCETVWGAAGTAARLCFSRSPLKENGSCGTGEGAHDIGERPHC